MIVSLDDKLVQKLRKIAAEQHTTLSGLIRDCLMRVAAEGSDSLRTRRGHEALERSFAQFSFKIGKRNWKREDLYERR
jgi:hypothetical protein